MLQLSNQPRQNELVSGALSAPCLFDLVASHPALRVSVIVPVRNEADYLEHTLDALYNQRNSDGSVLPHETYEVLLLANNCTDQSYEIARRYQARFPEFALHIATIWLAPDKANIGHVRRLLMDEACRRLLLTGNCTGIIASTDGDTVVDSYWIGQIIKEIDAGNDAVGGRILTRRHGLVSHTDRLDKRADAECSDAVRRYYLLDVMYRHLIARVEAVLDPSPNDPWPRHYQHFGASLAVTCTAYVKAGRLPEVPYLEDEAFYRALLRIDGKIRKSPQVKVFTSTRTQGRATVGFSWQLNQWATMNTARQLPLVDGADTILARFRQRRQLRVYWQTMAHTDRRAELFIMATELQIDPDWLCRETATNQYFGQLYENVTNKLTAAQPPQSLIPITTAIRELRDFLR